MRATGVTVTKSSTSIVLAVAFYAEHGAYSPIFISNYVDRYVRDELLRVPGVAEARIFSQRTYAMRLWLDPPKLAARKLTAADVVTRAARAEPRDRGRASSASAPAPPGQQLQISVRASGRLPDAAAFERLIVKTGPDGTLVQVKDVGRVELGAEDYGALAALRRPRRDRRRHLPAAERERARRRERGARATLDELAKRFPPGLHVRDRLRSDDRGARPRSTRCWSRSARRSLIVILVIFLFLQGWRPTLIPAITIPVSLIGTFMFVKLFGFSINTLTLFGLTLATGLVVDDAIVVIENIERHLARGRAPIRSARRRSR